MKKLILGALAVAAVAGAAIPAAAQTVVVREGRHGVVVREHDRYGRYHHAPRGHAYGYNHHRRHAVVWYDRWHHRHVTYRYY